MSLSSIVRVPEVGEVGVKATFRASGDPAGTELRYYLAYAPASSALVTLATVDAGDETLARLQVDATKAGYFTPDVPGHYQVECHDVTVTSTPRTWNEAPALPDTDNDFAGAPVLTLNTVEAASRYGYGDFRVVETVTRTIGQAPDTLAVSLRVHDNIETKLDDAVVFKPSSTKLAFVAAYDDQILGIRDMLRDGDIVGDSALQQRVGLSLSSLRFEWNAHLIASSTWTVHSVADVANVVPSATVTTLAGALTRLELLRTAYEAHRASATYHGAPRTADTTNVITLAAPTDLTTAIAFCRHLLFTIAHRGHFIGGGAHQNPGDPNGNYTFDFSSSLVGVLSATNEITRIWNLHCGRTSGVAPHSGNDTSNGISVIPDDTMTVAALVAWANAWADKIERHTADLDASGTPLVSPIHQNTHPIKLAARASGLADAIALIELCCVAEETHFLDGGTGDAHFGPQFGFHNRNGAWPAMTRLQRHWIRMTKTQLPSTPNNMNTEPTSLLTLGWR